MDSLVLARATRNLYAYVLPILRLALLASYPAYKDRRQSTRIWGISCRKRLFAWMARIKFLIVTFFFFLGGAATDGRPVNVQFKGTTQTTGPNDPSVRNMKNVMWVGDEDDALTHKKPNNNFVFLENRHEIQLYVPLAKDVLHTDCRVKITRTSLHCALANGPIYISGELMEPIQTEHSYWEYISEDELDQTDPTNDVVNGTHIYIFLVKAYANSPPWDALYKPLPVASIVASHVGVSGAVDDAESVDDAFGDDEKEDVSINGAASAASIDYVARAIDLGKKATDGDGEPGGEDVPVTPAIPPFPELIQLVRKLDMVAITTYLEAGDVNVKDEKGRTALMWLASDYQSVRHRVHGNEGQQQTDYIAGKLVAICHRLLAAGADSFQTDFYGMAAIHWAAASGWSDLAAVLLAQDEDMSMDMANMRDITNGSTPLHIASANGHSGVVDVLLARGARVNTRDKTERGWTALMFAAYNGQSQVCETLLFKNANHDTRDKLTGRTACHLAAAQGKMKVLEVMIAYEGCSMEIKDNNGATPYSIATRIGNDAMATLLRNSHVKSIEKKHEEWLKKTEL